MFAQESPRWLYAKGNKQGAEAALASLRGVSVAEKDVSVLAALNEIENNLAEEHRAHVGWLDCFRSERKTRYRTLLVMVCFFSTANARADFGINRRCRPANSLPEPTSAPCSHPVGRLLTFVFQLLLLWLACLELAARPGQTR